MATMEMFVRQHKEMRESLGRLRKAIQAPALADGADAIRSELSQVAGKLTVHLSMEDKQLYPSLAQDSRAAVRELSKGFSEEMMRLSSDFKEYSKKWQAQAIRAQPQEFARATTTLLDVLERRMSREEAELYPLLGR